jgi:HTH-type transcriptional regulator/antitoxin HigA
MATKTKSAGKANHQPRNAKNRGSKFAPVTVPAKIHPAYLKLIGRLPLRPIQTDAELDKAAAIIDELTDRDDLCPAESDYLEVLGDLVEKYEDAHVEMPHVSDAAMLHSLMEEKEVRQADVVRATGISKTVLSLILSGKRDLTREQIGAMSKYFEVDPAAFLAPA